MKKVIATLAVAAAVAIPASAQASSMGATRCQTTAPGFVQYLYERGVSCATARTVERYWTSHEILTPTVRVAGIRWAFQHRNYSTSADTSFNAGNRFVIVVSRPSS